MRKNATVRNRNLKTVAIVMILILILLIASSLACTIGGSGGSGNDNGADDPTTGWSAEQAINATATAGAQLWHAQLTAIARDQEALP